ncbi:aspartate/glutamate racemase family protein [Microbacterium galbinum]|uniref:Aspartate/glutamate racemase family protein n=1 Tax=Microbacterium galbinum TaxID=2851646 RepID=A0ABY4IN78_9MICO|nr:aspartate/glutamate racemase family protein [Microbacterium galbinum]UPL14222.1 aspartate/glutamate racemase family protein [Microbacterium galbinum]
MKTIGVLGGMSWESSLEWYRLANERVAARLGGYHSARILLDSLDFAEIEALQAQDDWDSAGALLADRARALEAAGAEILVLATNTMHLVADRITDAVGIPFLHIADAAGAAVSGAGLATVGLLGTAFTMDKPFYAEKLAAHGIRTLVPDADDRRTVHAVIYDELVHGVVRDESRRAYVEVVDRMVARGAEGIVLGCTEIELLLSASDVPVPVFPTTSLHVDAAIAAALAD